MKMALRKELPEPNPYYWDGPLADNKRVPFSQVEEVNGVQQAVVGPKVLTDLERIPCRKGFHGLEDHEYFVPDHIQMHRDPEDYKNRLRERAKAEKQRVRLAQKEAENVEVAEVAFFNDCYSYEA